MGFWIVQKFTRGISVETVKIPDDPIQIAINKSRIIDTAQIRFHMSKLSSSSKICIRGFINWGLGETPSSTAIFYIFGEVDNMICNFTSIVISMPSPLQNYLGWTSIIGHDVIDMGRKELLS